MKHKKAGLYGGFILAIALVFIAWWIFEKAKETTSYYGMAIMPMILVSIVLAVVGFAIGFFTISI